MSYVTNSPPTKAWYASLTLWGAALAVPAPLAGLLGFDLSQADQAEAAAHLAAIGGGIGGLLAIIGRLRAKARIGPGKTPANTVALAFALASSTVLAACAGVVEKPQTPSQRMAAAWSSFTVVVDGLTAARDAGLIEHGSATEASITQGIDSAHAALNAAHAAILADDDVSAADWLGIAVAGIARLQESLDRVKAQAAAPASIRAPPATPSIRQAEDGKEVRHAVA